MDATTADRIRARREELGLTQQALAHEVGVTHQHISRIEAGAASPSLDVLTALARSLAATTDFLLTGGETLTVDAVAAIRADRRLSARSKTFLAGLVEELRAAAPPSNL